MVDQHTPAPPTPPPPSAWPSLLLPAAVEVRLSIQQEVTWGQVVGVVGSSHELGAWHCDGAVRLAWSEGHNWSTVLHLPAG